MTSLEQHLTDHEYLDTFDGWESCECGWREEIERRSETGSVFTHAAHVADTWRESRTVRTVEELDALPQNSMTLDPQGRVWQHIREQWVALGRLHAPSSVPFPVTILWTPEDGAL